MPTANTPPHDIEFELRKLIVRYSTLFEQHQWPAEFQRWTELAFAFAARTGGQSEDVTRRVLEEMSALGLLEIDALAALAAAGGGVDTEAEVARRFLGHLRDNGFAHQPALDLLIALHEAALGLARGFDGKVQRYLRRYGEMMLDDIGRHFTFTRLAPEDVRAAFTYWLQNVLSMPLPADSPAVRAFCARQGISPRQLVAEVDDVDLNLALADDMIELDEARRNAAASA